MAMTNLLSRAAIALKPDLKAISLIETLRQREIDLLPKKKQKVGKKPVTVEQKMVGKLFGIWAIAVGKKKGNFFQEFEEITFFAKKNHCERFVSKLLEDFSERLKKRFAMSDNPFEKRLLANVSFESLSAAIGLQNSIKNNNEVARIITKSIRLKKVFGIAD
jgi:hypothetical protein